MGKTCHNSQPQKNKKKQKTKDRGGGVWGVGLWGSWLSLIREKGKGGGGGGGWRQLK